MDRKNYLTPEEQRLWGYIKEKQIIETEIVGQIFPEFSDNKRNKILHALYTKRFLNRAQRNLYYNPKTITGFYDLGLRIKEGYIGMGSALRHYGLLDYEDFTIIVVTKSFRKKIELERTQYMLEFLPLNNLYMGYRKEGSLQISTLEKTFFDCFLKPRYVGFSVLTKALYDAALAWKQFLSYFQKIENNALHQRTGYILEMLQKTTKKKIPPFVFIALKKKVKKPVQLISTKGTSTYNASWKIEDTLGSQKILSWWY